MPMYPSIAEAIIYFTTTHKLGGLFGAVGRITPFIGMDVPIAKQLMNKHGLSIPHHIQNNIKLDDKLFFKMIGYTDIESIDFSSAEGAEHIFNLNLSPPPII